MERSDDGRYHIEGLAVRFDGSSVALFSYELSSAGTGTEWGGSWESCREYLGIILGRVQHGDQCSALRKWAWCCGSSLFGTSASVRA